MFFEKLILVARQLRCGLLLRNANDDYYVSVALHWTLTLVIIVHSTKFYFDLNCAICT